jgi:hypothetical protein
LQQAIEKAMELAARMAESDVAVQKDVRISHSALPDGILGVPALGAAGGDGGGGGGGVEEGERAEGRSGAAGSVGWAA